ncbi:hypothetical protein MYP_3026 [Sporocytophaga myxococcoides]|uniref:Uncharacterized protein n=1 Tax=Sporocytophaga myxococcoides TaxID=153721 RepID=A0A098LHA7_9BACT|nr:hypothetical protein MYP_3026 [Sporocytophaga myxococcoides]
MGKLIELNIELISFVILFFTRLINDANLYLQSDSLMSGEVHFFRMAVLKPLVNKLAPICGGKSKSISQRREHYWKDSVRSRPQPGRRN